MHRVIINMSNALWERTDSNFFDSSSAPTPKSFPPHPLLLCKSWKYSSPPLPWLRKIANTTVTFWHVVWQFFLMKGYILIFPHKVIIAGVILPLDKHDWLKWSHDKIGLYDLVSWPWRLQWLSWDAWINVVMASVLASCWQLLVCNVWIDALGSVFVQN